MKHLKILTLVFCAGLLLCSCQYLGGRNNNEVKSFIPGTYVNYAQGEFSVAYDTLLIQPLEEGLDSYRIYQNTAFRRIENGKLMKTEHRRERWMAAYDQKTRTMLESKKGKVISIFPDSGLIVVGIREYRKIEKE